jgi:hypothetical protein
MVRRFPEKLGIIRQRVLMSVRVTIFRKKDCEVQHLSSFLTFDPN